MKILSFRPGPAQICVGLLLFSLLFVSVSCTQKKSSLSQQAVVKVNDSPLTMQEFAELLARKLRKYDALTVKSKGTLRRAKDEIIEDFIIRVVTKSWARQAGIFVRKEEIEAEINSIRSFYPDDLSFRKALTDQNLTFEDWKRKLSFSLLQKLVAKNIAQQLDSPSDESLKKYYKANKENFSHPEMVKITQIVLDSENNAKHILSEMRKGKKIEALAEKFSIAPEANKGGDIGWIEPGTLEVFSKAFKMRINQRSSIMKSPYGYHIYVVKGKKRAGTKKFEDVKDEIHRILVEKSEQKAYTKWLDEQLRTAKVYRNDDLINQLKVETKEEQ